ncbi:hypothetical protein VE00_10429 [Pseudogymnoascus sp. WSF 3629]|nr:hypothetical protein VE00_10429 [Pseudogymnoascus sp. WSF 3629]
MDGGVVMSDMNSIALAIAPATPILPRSPIDQNLVVTALALRYETPYRGHSFWAQRQLTPDDFATRKENFSLTAQSWRAKTSSLFELYSVLSAGTKSPERPDIWPKKRRRRISIGLATRASEAMATTSNLVIPGDSEAVDA